jgi:hypothetical protein
VNLLMEFLSPTEDLVWGMPGGIKGHGITFDPNTNNLVFGSNTLNLGDKIGNDDGNFTYNDMLHCYTDWQVPVHEPIETGPIFG